MSVRRNPVLWRASVAGAVTGLTVLATAAPGFACQPGGHDGSNQGDRSASSQHSSRTYHAEANSSAKEQQGSTDEREGDERQSSRHSDTDKHEASPSPKPSASASQAAGVEGDEGHNPPGNNGTVFIHDVAGDHKPHNVPHVGCTFYVDFFGFDNGQTVTVSFAGQAPTGAGTPLGGGWTGVVSTDDAGGAGNDWDYELPVDSSSMGLQQLGAPAKQGYHVKLTVATNEPGGKKSKVFWIEPCTAAGAASTSPSSSPSPSPSVLPTVSTGAGGGSVLGSTITRPGSAAAPQGAVLGESLTRAGTVGAAGGAGTAGATGAVAATSASSGGALPFTGAAHLTEMALGAAGLLAGGAGLMVAARRRRGRSEA